MSRNDGLGTSTVRRELIAFVSVGLLVLAVISIGAIAVIEQVATRQALEEDERITERLADFVFTPLLGAVVSGNVEQREYLDQVVDARLRDGSITRIDVWAADGTIVYADDAATIGRRYPVPDEVTAAIDRGQTSSDTATEPETGRANEPTLVEVYVPLRLPDRVLAFEAYFSYRSVEAQTSGLTQEIVPLAVGALTLLQLIQIPIAVSLARRVRRHEADRALLLEQALSASERERKEIAAGIHDGVVQDLAGVGYAIGALSRSVPPERREIADRLGATVRGSVEALRRLMIDIYPPDLSGSGLASAVSGLVEPLRGAGMTVHVVIDPLPALDPDIAAALYRTAREALTNVVKHAEAATVDVWLGPDDDPRWRGRDAVLLRVSDDGIGPPERILERRTDGHFGLMMLVDRLHGLGGELTLTAGPVCGTVAEARVPAQVGEPVGRRLPRRRVRGEGTRPATGWSPPRQRLPAERRTPNVL